MKIWGMLFVLLIALLAACDDADDDNGGADVDSATEAALVEVIERNAVMAQREDLDGYMATIHPSAPGYNETRDVVRQTSRTYDLTYAVSDIRVLSVDGDRARVAVTLTTRRVAGPEFRDNRIKAFYSMRQYNGEWRIYSQEIDDIDYLRVDPAAQPA